ncbi:MAG: LysR family transcriptional regulator [Gammaproteobacteria bacterium]|nr:LysR family transcriptional regulator [Gammaproteobacteria bacterium]
MNDRRLPFDWNHARAFLETAESGSLSAASRTLGLTQPTLGRQVAALEAQLGVTLFERSGRSLALTEAGLELLEHVRGMARAAELVTLAATGQSQSIEGQVCITASDTIATWHLPAVLARLRELAPQIEVEVLASNSIQDLRRREADIAIRHVRPEQPELITRLIAQTSAHLYASSDYLDRIGRPICAQALEQAVFIGYDSSERMLTTLNALGLSLSARNFKLITNSGITAWEMVKQGLGIGIHTREVAAMTADVEVVLPELVSIPVPLWLTAHRELRTNRRIRLVFDLLAEAFSSLARPD